MKVKKILALGLAAMMAVTLSACGNKDGGSNNSNTDNTDSEKSQQGGGEDSGASLVIYTNSGSDGRDAWLKDYAKENGFNVQVVQIQGGDLGNRIVSEKNNVQADLVFGLNNVEYEKLKAEDTLEQWEPAWKDEVDLSLGDADGYYYPLVIQPLVNIMRESSFTPRYSAMAAASVIAVSGCVDMYMPIRYTLICNSSASDI